MDGATTTAVDNLHDGRSLSLSYHRLLTEWHCTDAWLLTWKWQCWEHCIPSTLLDRWALVSTVEGHRILSVCCLLVEPTATVECGRTGGPPQIESDPLMACGTDGRRQEDTDEQPPVESDPLIACGVGNGITTIVVLWGTTDSRFIVPTED